MDANKLRAEHAEMLDALKREFSDRAYGGQVWLWEGRGP